MDMPIPSTSHALLEMNTQTGVAMVHVEFGSRPPSWPQKAVDHVMELFMTDRHQHLPAATMLHVLDSTPLRHSRTSQCGRTASSRRAAAAARRSARGPHAPRSGSRARTAATSDASAATNGVCHRAKLLSYLILSISSYLILSSPSIVSLYPPDKVR